MQSAREYFDYLNHAYVAVHRTKEDLFWATYMATSDDHAAFARAEGAYKEFIGDPAKLTKTRDELAAVRAAPPGAERDALLHGLGGWLALFEANIIDSPDGRTLMREIVDAESVLFERKRAHEPRHLNDQGEWEVASLPMLATNLATNRVEERRKSSFDAFRDIERWVLDHGFLELVRLRNRFARALGYANYFDLKLQKNERLETPALLHLLDDFVRQTDAANARALAGPSHASRCSRHRAMESAVPCIRRRHPPARPVPALRTRAAPLDRQLPPARDPVSGCDDAAGPARASGQASERVLPRTGAELDHRDRALGACRDQLHRGGETGSGRQRPPRHQHAVPRRRPRRAFRQRGPELAVLLAGVPADVDGLRGNAIDVLRPAAVGSRLDDALCRVR